MQIKEKKGKEKKLEMTSKQRKNRSTKRNVITTGLAHRWIRLFEQASQKAAH
jgi:hypothetical protein